MGPSSRGWSRSTARDKYLPACDVDGGMSRQHFHTVLRALGFTEVQMHAITSSVDRNSTGFVGLEELLDFFGYEEEIEVSLCIEATPEAMQKDESKAALKEIFDKMDKDGNGKVSSKEWGSKVGQNMVILGKHFGGATPAEVGQA